MTRSLRFSTFSWHRALPAAALPGTGRFWQRLCLAQPLPAVTCPAHHWFGIENCVNLFGTKPSARELCRTQLCTRLSTKESRKPPCVADSSATEFGRGITPTQLCTYPPMPSSLSSFGLSAFTLPSLPYIRFDTFVCDTMV